MCIPMCMFLPMTGWSKAFPLLQPCQSPGPAGPLPQMKNSGQEPFPARSGDLMVTSLLNWLPFLHTSQGE